MDRYFYSVEQDMSGKKYVHVSGNVHFNDVDESETCYRFCEFAGLYVDMAELADTMSGRLEFCDYVNARLSYLTDITEEQAIDICRTYWAGISGEELDIIEVNENAPCGYYWFEVKEEK